MTSKRKNILGAVFFLLLFSFVAIANLQAKEEQTEAKASEETAQASEAKKAEPKLFSHQFHFEDVGMEECQSCHQIDERGAMPAKKSSCGDCHDEEMFPVRLEKSAKPMQMEFPHEKHIEAFDCTDCHKGAKEDAFPQGKALMDKARCDECHHESGIKVEEAKCALCHGTDYRKHKPTDHSGVWMKRHGKEANWRQFKTHGKSCTLCHTESACISCHRENKPQSHTGLWRMQGHGRAASWDRDNCKTCHETGVCIRCHRETRPMNHRGGWKYMHGKTGSVESCSVCHHNSYCQTCHK